VLSNPEIIDIAGATHILFTAATPDGWQHQPHQQGEGREARPGSKNMAPEHIGSPRNLGDLAASEHEPEGKPVETPDLPEEGTRQREEQRTTGCVRYP
jgi:hypothetical protein